MRAAARDVVPIASVHDLVRRLSGLPEETVARHLAAPIGWKRRRSVWDYNLLCGPGVGLETRRNKRARPLFCPAGAVSEGYVYDPYGKVTFYNLDWSVSSPTSSVGWIYLHQGGRWDSVSGLYNFRNRDLSPTLGQWLQVDPIGFDAGDRNLYRYEFNGPVTLLDSSGNKVQLRCSDVLTTSQQHCGIIVSCNGKEISYDLGARPWVGPEGKEGPWIPDKKRQDPARHDSGENLYDVEGLKNCEAECACLD